MKKNLIFAVIGVGAVATAVAVGRKIYEIGLETGKFTGFIDGVTNIAELASNALRKNVEIRDKYDELSDKYDELMEDYNEVCEKLENKEFYGG